MTADPFARPGHAARARQLWPDDTELPASPGVLLAALGIGVVAALILRPEGLGLGCTLVGIGILGVAHWARSSGPSRDQLGWSLLTMSLLSIATIRAAPWLVALCLLAACFTGTLSVVNGRTWSGLLVGGISGSLVPLRAARWVRSALAQMSLPCVRSTRGWIVAGVTTGLVAVFGSLFAAADAAFAGALTRLTPDLSIPDLGWRLTTLGVVSLGAISIAYLARNPPNTDSLAPKPGTPVHRWEWTVPVAALVVLFLGFVLVQLTVLFGGRRHVLTTQGLSYAEYARQGFWQLLVVTVLTLAVIALAVRHAPRSTATDLRLVRLLLALLCVLALVIVVSALHRMSLYQQEYGFTRLRLFVDAVELALGATFLLILAAGVRFTATWLPRAVVSLGVVSLLGLAALNPDAYIADRNISRFERTGQIDLTYLASLSPDALPHLMGLPNAERSCALRELGLELQGSADPWYDLNVARARARDLVVDHPVENCQAGGIG